MVFKQMKKVCGLLAILFTGVLVGYFLLVAVYSLPVEPMAAHVCASVPALNGQWGSEESYEQLVKGYETTQLDNSTDAVMMLAAVYQDDQNPFVQAAEGRSYIGGETAFHTLLSYAEGETLESVSVARYWHGYLVLLKPLLLLFSYLDIRVILMMAQGAMIAAVIAGMCKRKLDSLVPAFLVSMICITPAITGFSLQFSTALCTALGAMMVLLYLPPRRIQSSTLSRIFLLTGMVTSYVDYLTYPIITLGMPLCLCFFLFPEAEWKKELCRFVTCCICWAIGYFGMWAGKWVIAGVLGREQWFWANLLDKIKQRSSSQSGEVAITYLDVLISVFKPFVKRAYLLAGMIIGLAWLTLFVHSRRYPAQAPQPFRAVLLVITGLMPFAWYFVTKNHSYNHAFFTSRSLAVSAFAFACLLTTFLRQKPDNGLADSV